MCLQMAVISNSNDGGSSDGSLLLDQLVNIRYYEPTVVCRIKIYCPRNARLAKLQDSPTFPNFNTTLLKNDCSNFLTYAINNDIKRVGRVCWDSRAIGKGHGDVILEICCSCDVFRIWGPGHAGTDPTSLPSRPLSPHPTRYFFPEIQILTEI